MQIQRTLSGSEDIVALAADHLPYQRPALASLVQDLLDGIPFFDRARMAASVSSRRNRPHGHRNSERLRRPTRDDSAPSIRR